MKRQFIATIVSWLIFSIFACAQTHVRFDNPETWTTSELGRYVGQTIIFDQPVYICNNYTNLIASLHRTMSPTNQAIPLSDEYASIIRINQTGEFSISGLSGYHRMGEVIYGMKAKVNTIGSVTYLSSDKIVGTREDLKTPPSVDMVREADTLVKHDLLVCAANLEYYLAEQFDPSSGMGPRNAAEHEKQKTKVLSALALIKADIYGFVEVQQGQTAIAELAQELTTRTGRHYTYINDGGSANGTYTKSGYVYCTDVVRTHGEMKSNNTAVVNRKKMQCFEIKSTGERFIFSLNHFKAKSGSGTGLDANQNDGQGIFNQTRINEANSVLSSYATNKNYYGDEDILIMGDLNAYGKEDPIMTLINGGMVDLHRYFHADSSYSYTFHGQAGYLDHALCNSSMLTQVTGMAAFHVNSDEHDNYTYDKSSDLTMFRYSDHDPVLVGLRLGANLKTKDTEEQELTIQNVSIEFEAQRPVINMADGGHYVICSASGHSVCNGRIEGDHFIVETALPQGLYIINVYAHGSVARQKYFVY